MELGVRISTFLRTNIVGDDFIRLKLIKKLWTYDICVFNIWFGRRARKESVERTDVTKNDVHASRYFYNSLWLNPWSFLNLDRMCLFSLITWTIYVIFSSIIIRQNLVTMFFNFSLQYSLYETFFIWIVSLEQTLHTNGPFNFKCVLLLALLVLNLSH